jgi:hypothetical protein
VRGVFDGVKSRSETGRRWAEVQPNSTIHKQAAALMLVVGVMLLSACVAGQSSTETPTPPAQATQQVWEPPEPSSYVVMPTPTVLVASPETVLIYKANVHIGMKIMTITDNEVFFTEDPKKGYTLRMPVEERLRQILSELDALNYENAITINIPLVTPTSSPSTHTITYKTDSGHKTITSYDLPYPPNAFTDLIAYLDGLAVETMREGIVRTEPASLIWYRLDDAQGRQWLMVIDVDGGVSYSYPPFTDSPSLVAPPSAYLTPEDMQELKNLFADPDWNGGKELHLPPGGLDQYPYPGRGVFVSYWRDVSAIGEYEHASIGMGASIPDHLDLILTKLAQIYDKYAPREHIK